MIDVALFPIPGSVTFPGVPVPLHVFEPRYRKMVRYCIEEHVPLGVCHTEKIVHARTGAQTVEEALGSNQSTYKPCEVFSAGPVRLRQELDDGRLLITVESDVRLRLSRERQTLPFSIWSCDVVTDIAPDTAARSSLSEYRDKILHRLIALTDAQPEVQRYLKSDHWQSMTDESFSYAIAGSIGMDPTLAQQLLETRDTAVRLEALLQLINGAG